MCHELLFRIHHQFQFRHHFVTNELICILVTYFYKVWKILFKYYVDVQIEIKKLNLAQNLKST